MNLLKSVAVALVATASLALAAPASAALITVGQSAFTTGVTTVTFEDLPGSGYAGAYGAANGLVLSAKTAGLGYTEYGAALAKAAIDAGLGSTAATWGSFGNYGTGFSFTSAHELVGFYMSSNVNILNTVVSAYLGNTLLGSTTVNVAANAIGFVGFKNAGGIDRIVIGNNQSYAGFVHQLDNVMFSNTQAVPEPASAALAGLGLLGLVFMRRRR